MCRLQMKSIKRGVQKSLHNLFLTLLGQIDVIFPYFCSCYTELSKTWGLGYYSVTMC